MRNQYTQQVHGLAIEQWKIIFDRECNCHLVDILERVEGYDFVFAPFIGHVSYILIVVEPANLGEVLLS